MKRYDLVDYFGRERLQLTNRVINRILVKFKQLRKPWNTLLVAGFLTAEMKEKYQSVLEDRFARLFG